MELRSIYRTYRPQRWADVVGQELIVRTLTNEIAHDTLVHAYLFTGTRGVGKTTTARLLAKSVNCEKRKKGEAEPCNTCDSCVAITNGRSLDVMEIDAASHTGVDNVRENIIAASRVAPLREKMKVFIIDEVHMLSQAAFNALLKTLEEPSANVLFILATTDADRVLETIISRCQRFDFRRVTEVEMQKRLEMLAKSEGVSIASEVLAAIVRHAGGSLRDSESMLGQLIGLGKKKITEEEAALILPRGDTERAKEFIHHLFSSDGCAALELVDEFVARGGDVALFIDDCIRIARSLLLDAVYGRASKDGAPVLCETLAKLLRRFFESAREVAFIHPPELVLELIVAEYTRTNAGSNADERGRLPKADPPQAEKNQEIPKLKKEEKAARAGIALTIAAIHDRWQHVLTTAKKYNHSLALILKVATPVAIEANVLTLGFRYSFHADRLEDRGTKTVACRILEEVFTCPLDLRTTVVQDDTKGADSAPKGDANTLISDLLSTFGGKVKPRRSA